MEWITSVHWGDWVIIGVAVYFFGTPLLFMPFFRIEAKPTLQLVVPEELLLPSVVQQHLDAVETELDRRGFVNSGTLLVPSAVPSAISVLRIYINRASRVSAMANSVFTINKTKYGVHINRVQYVEFTTRYANGEVFNTLNPKVGGLFPIPPRTLTVRVPWITDVGQLYEIHEAITAAKGPAGPKVLRLDAAYGGDIMAFVQGCACEELEQASAAGYLKLLTSGSHYRPTIYGAYRMTWKQLSPIRQLLARLDRRRAESLFREIGI
jgi:hypothetical protein